MPTNYEKAIEHFETTGKELYALNLLSSAGKVFYVRVRCKNEKGGEYSQYISSAEVSHIQTKPAGISIDLERGNSQAEMTPELWKRVLESLGNEDVLKEIIGAVRAEINAERKEHSSRAKAEMVDLGLLQAERGTP